MLPCIIAILAEAKQLYMLKSSLSAHLSVWDFFANIELDPKDMVIK